MLPLFSAALTGMTQGFKPLKKAPVAGAKAKGKNKHAAPRPKVGKKIAPKKQTAMQEALQNRVRGHY